MSVGVPTGSEKDTHHSRRRCGTVLPTAKRRRRPTLRLLAVLQCPTRRCAAERSRRFLNALDFRIRRANQSAQSRQLLHIHSNSVCGSRVRPQLSKHTNTLCAARAGQTTMSVTAIHSLCDLLLACADAHAQSICRSVFLGSFFSFFRQREHASLPRRDTRANLLDSCGIVHPTIERQVIVLDHNTEHRTTSQAVLRWTIAACRQQRARYNMIVSSCPLLVAFATKMSNVTGRGEWPSWVESQTRAWYDQRPRASNVGRNCGDKVRRRHDSGWRVSQGKPICPRRSNSAPRKKFRDKRSARRRTIVTDI
ncbi:hexose carrier protein [Pseudozyma hubeiensis SY62]|uniref:Hexose carrier protein n=1 Tax=Pseudozyma hubeiensis (strain SY62) TaxID=1305764 RepID=R9P911_PSEHS|nr:hexose carrier protein [Pseudozyma hubeiensis SY62]GAC97752.1 hexose carrier protein [Pseudozyma hubeiensis SY62]